MEAELIRLLSEKMNEQVARIAERVDALKDLVKQAADNNARLMEFMQRQIEEQNARLESRNASLEGRITSLDSRIDTVKYWIIGATLTLLLGVGGLVLMLHQSNQQMFSNILSIIQQLGRLPPS